MSSENNASFIEQMAAISERARTGALTEENIAEFFAKLDFCGVFDQIATRQSLMQLMLSLKEKGLLAEVVIDLIFTSVFNRSLQIINIAPQASGYEKLWYSAWSVEMASSEDEALRLLVQQRYCKTLVDALCNLQSKGLLTAEKKEKIFSSPQLWGKINREDWAKLLKKRVIWYEDFEPKGKYRQHVILYKYLHEDLPEDMQGALYENRASELAIAVCILKTKIIKLRESAEKILAGEVNIDKNEASSERRRELIGLFASNKLQLFDPNEKIWENISVRTWKSLLRSEVISLKDCNWGGRYPHLAASDNLRQAACELNVGSNVNKQYGTSTKAPKGRATIAKTTTKKKVSFCDEVAVRQFDPIEASCPNASLEHTNNSSVWVSAEELDVVEAPQEITNMQDFYYKPSLFKRLSGKIKEMFDKLRQWINGNGAKKRTIKTVIPETTYTETTALLGFGATYAAQNPAINGDVTIKQAALSRIWQEQKEVPQGLSPAVVCRSC